ncbi:MAG: bifunctional folylpolyglutamate synthase/dihydrofolate synthase, partial [Solobacterium sp.]|nr:bifunctional folylpolyglutamate synthase/dihydrofolate synthase [Solobacterium sp.]
MERRSRNHTVAYFAEAMAAAGSPQEAFETVHVTGTNGKGSTCYYLNHILQASGRKTGLFTSPHLVTHYDRMRINDACIAPEMFMDLLNRYLGLIEQYDLGM